MQVSDDAHQETSIQDLPAGQEVLTDSTPQYRIPSKAYRVIKKCHNAISGDGHGGVERTIEAVKLSLKKEEFEWPTLRKDVIEFCRRCPCCQKQSLIRPTIKTKRFILSSRDKAMKDIAIDTLGPFPADEQGNTYIVVITDCFSRYVELFPAADATADAAASAIRVHFQYFGVPNTVRSDNGAQYANKVLTHLAKITGLEFTRTIAYSHEENG
jgi:hypothetical protein